MVPAETLTRAFQGAAPWPGGDVWGLWCRSLGGAVVEWLSAGGVTLAGVATGAAGAGTVTGALNFTATTPLVTAALTGAGLAGPSAAGVGAALAGGLSTAFTSAPYAGPVTGVATGTDVTAVAAVNVPLLVATLARHHATVCAAVGGTGPSSPVYHGATAAAIGAWFASGAGTGVVSPTGPVAPATATGVSQGRFV